MQQTETLKANKHKKTEQKNFSSIVAYVHISESELIKAYSNYDSSWETSNQKAFEKILYDLGLNTEQPYKRYDGLTHRNRLGEVVVCSRWVGNERHDSEWIESGYASREALDRAKNSRLLDNLYAQKGLTKAVQDMLEQRDMYEDKE